MGQVQRILIKNDDVGLRVDRWFKLHYPYINHNYLEKLLRTGQVRINGSRVKSGTRLKAGQFVRVPPLDDGLKMNPSLNSKSSKPDIKNVEIKKLKNRIIHIDDDVLIFDKPPGLAVQGGSKLSRNLDDILDMFCFEKNEKPRLVHRLDKDTSGLLLLARNVFSARELTKSFRYKKIRKIYWSIVVGVPLSENGIIDLKLAKLQGLRGEKVEIAISGGKVAQTKYRVVDQITDKASWIIFEPLTGRTHQIRAHAAALGTPILGDKKYGQRKSFINNERISSRLHLHARGLQFPHPSGHMMEAIAPIPNHIKQTFEVFGFDYKKEKIIF